MTLPNILIAMTDDHGQWLAGAYGNNEIETPTIDNLAANGACMQNAFCPTPVCSPARANLFTGRYASQHGIHDWLQADYEPGYESNQSGEWLGNEVTLPELLGDAGYVTGLSGKWHCGRGYEQEIFDHAATKYSEDWDVPGSSLANDRRATDRAIQFLREDRGENPFFLFVGLTAPHGPWESEPERLVEKYRDSPFSDIPNDITYPFGRRITERYYILEDEHEGLAQMYAAVHGIDEQLGRLIDELEDQELFNDTLIVYTADHGHNCGHHGLWGKGNCTGPQNMLEESIRIPMIISGHNDVIGKQNRIEFVDHCDTFQTLLDFVGIDPPPDYQYPGESYLQQLIQLDGPFEWDQTQVCEYGNVRMARNERYKLVRRYPDGPDLLFDLDEDPRETRNKIDFPAYAEIRGELEQIIDQFFDTYADPEKDGTDPWSLPQPNELPAWERHDPDEL